MTKILWLGATETLDKNVHYLKDVFGEIMIQFEEEKITSATRIQAMMKEDGFNQIIFEGYSLPLVELDVLLSSSIHPIKMLEPGYFSRYREIEVKTQKLGETHGWKVKRTS